VHPVAVYRRRIRASLVRIWENVLDWEHLPWLHAPSFVGIELVTSDRDGWRAWIDGPPVERPRRSLVEVRLHRPELHYWTRTVEGFGAGSSIRTSLAPGDGHATDIAVEFFVPGVTAAAEASVGRAYRDLYARLWDEDEAMMVRRQELLDASAAGDARTAPVQLGALASLRQRLPIVVGSGRDAVRVIDVDGKLVAHAAVCPHLGGPLAVAATCDGIVTCPWHGYRFDVRTGAPADGHALRLPAAPRVHVSADGMVSLLPA
jgi:nitrite reductase/ring-hydroxylating ferredoxin subunit